MLISKDTPVDEILKIENTNPYSHCKLSSGYVLDEEIKDIANFLGITEEELKREYLEKAERFGREIFRVKQEKKKLSTEEGEIELPHGKCVFYDERFGCLLGDKRPLFCKLPNHPLLSKDIIEWFDINFIIDPDDPKTLREWEQYVKMKEDVIPGGEIENIIPKEQLEKIRKKNIFSKTQKNVEELKEELNNLLKQNITKTD